MRLRPAAIVGTLLLTIGLLAAGVPTNAAASAPRCTITGTQGNDRLVGTRGIDTICGLGGNDVISGGGGPDYLHGGAGNDQIYGGNGYDYLYGGTGADRLSGGRGGDRVFGEGGNDRLRGDEWHDQLSGGPGADWLLGGTGFDVVGGGLGVDSCPYDARDDLNSCIYDRRPPRAVSVTASPTSVDVTEGSKMVTIRAHLTDDSSVEGAWPPYLYLQDFNTVLPVSPLVRVSGTPRDGVWQTRVVVPKGFPDATMELTLHAADPAERRLEHVAASFLRIIDNDPDVDYPSVHLQTPKPTTDFDVRNSPQTVPIRARITDERTGVHPDVAVCVYRRYADGWFSWYRCSSAKQASGTMRDGVWQGAVKLPQGLRGGDYCIGVLTTDRARPGRRPTTTCGRVRQHAWHTSENFLPLASGTGELSVLGLRDNHPPRLLSYSHSPDPTQGPVTVNVQAADSVGVSQVRVHLVRVTPEGAKAVTPGWPLRRIGGNAQSGTWTTSLDLFAEDLPAGRYYPVVEVFDASHMRAYGGPTARSARVDPVIDLSGDPYFDHAP